MTTDGQTSACRARQSPRTSSTRYWLVATVIGLLVFAVSGTAAWAQTAEDALRIGQRSPATGATMMGYAGAGVAGVADIGALYANPAGLGFYETSQAAGTLRFLNASDDARFDPIAPDDPTSSTQNVTDVGLDNLALVYKAPTERGSLVFGAGFNQTATFERSLEYQGTNSLSSITDTFLPPVGSFEIDNGDILFDRSTQRIAFDAGAIEFFEGDFEDGFYPFLQAVAPGTEIQQQEDVIEEGRLNEINLGGAVEAAPNLMAGLSLNVSFGSYEFTRSYREDDVFGENTPDMYSVELGDGQLLRGFDFLDVRERISSDFVGVNARGGVSIEPTPRIRLGATVETPTVYSVEEVFGTRIRTGFEEGGELEGGSIDANEFEYRIRTPWRFGAGVSVDIVNMRLMADVEYVDWSALEIRSDAVDFFDVNDEIRREFSATTNIRGGIEWEVPLATLRGGVAYQPDPRDTEIQLPGGETTDRTKTFLTAGIGFDLSPQLRLDVGWMQERFDDQYRPYASVEVPGEFDDDGNPIAITAPFVDEEIRRSTVRIGLSYNF